MLNKNESIEYSFNPNFMSGSVAHGGAKMSSQYIASNEGYNNPHPFSESRRIGNFNIMGDFNYYGINKKRNESFHIQNSVDSQEEKVDIL